MRLVNSTTKEEIKCGDSVTTFRGEVGKLRGFSPPRHQGSTGRVYVLLEGMRYERAFFPSVINAEIVE